MEEELSQYQNLIIANGEFPDHPLHLQLLKNAKMIICCDGAVEKLIKTDFLPTAIVGDGDSISAHSRERFQEIFYQDTNEEVNDLNKALTYCLKLGVTKVAILGAFGLREDHALANLGVMMMFAEKEKMDLLTITHHGVFTPATNTITLNSFPKQQVSVFSFLPDTRLTFHGLKYPVNQRSFTYLWEGGMNEAIDNSFTIEFDNGKILVYRELEIAAINH